MMGPNTHFSAHETAALPLPPLCPNRTAASPSNFLPLSDPPSPQIPLSPPGCHCPSPLSPLLAAVHPSRTTFCRRRLKSSPPILKSLTAGSKSPLNPPHSSLTPPKTSTDVALQIATLAASHRRLPHHSSRPYCSSTTSCLAPIVVRISRRPSLLCVGAAPKLLTEAPKYKFIAPSVLSDHLRINGSLARKTIRELMARGLIRMVSAHTSQHLVLKFLAIWELHLNDLFQISLSLVIDVLFCEMLKQRILLGEISSTW